MANIDITKIDGYAQMTPEQKVAALESYDFDGGNDAELDKLRKAISKANSEAAESKRQLREKQTAEEIAKAEQESKQKELQEKYDALLKEQTISKYAAKYREQGYDEKLAMDTAEALYSGDTDKVFANATKFHTEFEKSIRADVTKNTPKPNNGGDGGVVKTKADILKIQDASERQKAIAENIDLFIDEE
jgi:hypothetical protein